MMGRSSWAVDAVTDLFNCFRIIHMVAPHVLDGLN